MAAMTEEQKFFNALSDLFIGAKVEGEGGYVNLMRIKASYYRKIEELLKQDIDKALQKYPHFREELFNKLYTFFSRYFTKNGCIYFNRTPYNYSVYERIYTDDRDVILFWKTSMLYYVKTDRIFRSMEVEILDDSISTSRDGKENEKGKKIKFFFDVSKLEHKKANEKRELIYSLKEVKDDGMIVFEVHYSERGRKTDIEEIQRELKKMGIKLKDETLEKAFSTFEKQSEVDYFINKNTREFLKEQFKLWLYQYVYDEESEWPKERIDQLQILKDIAYKIIDFIAQFEDELVKIWDKPKFVRNSNYVITLDRINNLELIEKIVTHPNIEAQIKEWQELGIVDEEFTPEEVFEDMEPEEWKLYSDPSLFSPENLKARGLITTGYHLPYNPKLVEPARKLRRNMTEAEKKLWYGYLRNSKYPVLRQRPIDNFIVDFYCAKLKLVIEIDGEQHYTDEGKIYDEERTKILEGYGLRVIRFTNKEVMENFEEVCRRIEMLISPVSPLAKGGRKGGIKKQYRHLPIDTKYFKDLELEILSQFENLDQALDGWLIKSENYQALNTILPKFREGVQTIYIDPPFNKEQDADYFYSVKYKDSTWATMLENRLRLARELLNEKGSIFVRCDYNGNWIVRPLMDEIFGKENFRNEISVRRFKKNVMEKTIRKLPEGLDTIYVYCKNSDRFSYINPYKTKIEAREGFWRHMGDSSGQGSPKIFFGKELAPPPGKHWKFSQEKIDQMIDEGKLILD